MPLIPAHRARLGALVLSGIAAVTVATATLGPAMAARNQHRPVVAPSAVPVVISCTGHGLTRPASYVLACADGNAYIKGLKWASWESASAFASGTYTFRACVPSCAAGKLHSFPMLAALWRAKARPGHTGQRYFTRLTLILTGTRSYRAGGKSYKLPATLSFPLSASGGA